MKLSFNIYLHWINKLNIWPWTSIKRRSRLLWLNLLRASAANITVIFVKIEDGATVLSLCLFLCLPVRQAKEENKNWKKKKAGKLQKRNKKNKKKKVEKTVQRQPMAGLRSRSLSEDSEGIRCFDQVDIVPPSRHSIYSASKIFIFLIPSFQ